LIPNFMPSSILLDSPFNTNGTIRITEYNLEVETDCVKYSFSLPLSLPFQRNRHNFLPSPTESAVTYIFASIPSSSMHQFPTSSMYVNTTQDSTTVPVLKSSGCLQIRMAPDAKKVISVHLFQFSF